MTPASGSLTAVTARTFWDSRGSNNDFDLDLAAFLLSADGTVAADTDFVFFNNPVSSNGAVKHAGGSEGVVEETLSISLGHLPPSVTAVAILATVYNASGTFGDLCDAILAVDDDVLGTVVNYELAEGRPAARALVHSVILRDGDRWILQALGEVENDLLAAARRFGVNV